MAVVYIDEIFGKGDSQASAPGRNDAEIKLALGILGDPEDIFLLGCGMYELITTSHQPKLRPPKTSMIKFIDRSDDETGVNYLHVMNPHARIHFSLSNLLMKTSYERISSQDLVSDMSKRLQQLGIKGVYIDI
ncbi:hypothetical protein JXB41_02685 [Candidatus Woesearchaeota archaeon]|nr:hypothetical protein [Candidatus Woesearchaeota archaeon]